MVTADVSQVRAYLANVELSPEEVPASHYRAAGVRERHGFDSRGRGLEDET